VLRATAVAEACSVHGAHDIVSYFATMFHKYAGYKGPRGVQEINITPSTGRKAKSTEADGKRNGTYDMYAPCFVNLICTEQ